MALSREGTRNCATFITWAVLPISAMMACDPNQNKHWDLLIKKQALINADIFCRTLGGHSSGTYSKFSEKLTFLTSWDAHVRVRIRR